MVRPLYCRVGAKSSIKKKIIPLIPNHKIYVEPFIGGGAIFFEKELAEKNVINDLETDLIRDYKIARDAPSDKEKYKKDLDNTNALQRYYFMGSYNSPADKFMKTIIKRCNGFGGNPVSTTIKKDSNPYNKIKLLDQYQEKLKATTILNQDYKSVIKTYDSSNTFFYLDPPYEKSKGLYKEFSIDFEEMARLLKSIKGQFLLSINDSSTIRNIFKDFKQIKLVVAPQSRFEGAAGSKPRAELLIKNY
jgi:DNA adenine methylase